MKKHKTQRKNGAIKQTKCFFSLLPCFLASALILSASGCASTNSLLSSRGKDGKTFVYDAGYDQVYQAAFRRMQMEGYKILRKDRGKGEILASDTLRFLSGGGRMAVFLDRVDERRTRVEVHSRPFMYFPTPTIFWAAGQRTKTLDRGILEEINSP